MSRRPTAAASTGPALARHVHLVQGDLAHFGLAGLDVGPQQHRGLVAALALDRLEDLGVFVVGGVDARLLGEVQPPTKWPMRKKVTKAKASFPCSQAKR